MAGRKKPLPRNALATIRDMASRGFSERDIARSIGLCQKTFTLRKNEDPAVQDALDAGRCVEHQALYGKLYEKAMNGEIVALLFLLKCRHGYREIGDVAPTNAVQVVISMPGAMDRDAYVKLVTNESKVDA